MEHALFVVVRQINVIFVFLLNGDECGVDFSDDEEITVEPNDCISFCSCSSAFRDRFSKQIKNINE